MTLARQGLLRPNDRLFIPIAYVKHQEPTIETRDRARAHLERRPLAPPSVDPDSWAGRAIKQDCSKAMFSRGKKVGLALVCRKLTWGVGLLSGGGSHPSSSHFRSAFVSALLQTLLLLNRLRPLPVHVKLTVSSRSLCRLAVGLTSLTELRHGRHWQVPSRQRLTLPHPIRCHRCSRCNRGIRKRGSDWNAPSDRRRGWSR